MIAWLNAPALWGLAATAVAVLVHVLFRPRARRVPFPSLRFVQPSLASALRLRRPADLALLAVRAAILASAALALAQPLLVIPARYRAWDGRVARVVIVDTSDSMRASAAQADQVAAAELSGAFTSSRVDAADLRDGLRRASAWLEQAPPARREIVVISDFQQGALDAGAIAAAPPGAGLRFARVGTLPRARDFTAPPILDRDGVATPRVRLEGAETGVEIARTPGQPGGLEIIAPAGEEPATRELRHVVAAAGTPAPSGQEPVVVVLAGATPPDPVQRPARAWMLRALVALSVDDDLAALGRPPATAPSSDAWVTVLEDAARRPLVRAAASGERLVVDVAARPSEFLAAAALRGVLAARPDRGSMEEHEVLSLPPALLAGWARTPPPLDATSDAWRHAASDGRWLWALVLVLLGVEAMMRREPAKRGEVRADAA